MAPDPSEILRAQKFDQLMREDAEQFPNSCYDSRYQRVCNSESGVQLLAQMHQANQHSDADAATSSNASSTPVGGYKTSAEAKAAFKREFDKLHQHLSYDHAWNTAAGTEPGKTAYIAWKVLAQKEKNLPPIVTTPAREQLPPEAFTKFRD